MRMTRLKVSSLRGIPPEWPVLEIGEQGLVVHGPNGTGKSSIIDAVEFALAGRSTLFPANRIGVNWDAAAEHLRGGPFRIQVTVREDGQDLIRDTAVAVEGDMAHWCGHAERSSFVLRRHMLLTFIDTKPKERYAQLEPFLSLDGFLRVEAALGALAEQARVCTVAATTAVATAEQRLRAVFGLPPEEVISERHLVDHVDQLLTAAGYEIAGDRDVLRGRKAEVEAALQAFAQDARVATLHGLRDRAQHLTLPYTFRPLLDQLEISLAAHEAELAGHGREVITTFLKQGRKIIEEAAGDLCPVCEQEIDRDELLARLAERIALDERVTATSERVARDTRAAKGALANLSTEFTKFLAAWDEARLGALSAEYKATTDFLREAAGVLDNPLTHVDARDISARLAASVADHAAAMEVIEAEIIQATGGDRRSSLARLQGMLKAFEVELPAYQGALANLTKANGKKSHLDRLLGHAVSARKSTVQQVLDDVTCVANEFYSVIHPEEGLNTSRLIVRPKEDGSVHMQTSFYGKQAPPLLHYSESHLDTLGLCFFLALRKREADANPSFKILVLDDVMHSVDAAHRTRFVDLLKEQFSDHQIIAVTHDDIFFDRLKHAFGNGCSYARITGWDIVHGPILGDASSDIDVVLRAEVRGAKNTADIAAACGRFFEWYLRQQTESLQVAIQARFTTRPDIANMWPPLAKKLKEQPHFRAVHPRVCERLNASLWVRNQVGAHNNEPPAPVDRAEANEFALALGELYGATCCNRCKGFLRKLSDKDWRCRCGELSYAPQPATPQAPVAQVID